MKRKFIIILIFVMVVSVSACAPKLTEETGDLIPDILSEKNFIYDELGTGEGNSLYTLQIFAERI